MLIMAFRIALRALARNKLRSFLTMLGIIIGVGAVIAMVAIGEGAKKRVQEQIASLGTNLLVILPGTVTLGGARSGSGGRQSLIAADAKAIMNEIPVVAGASPFESAFPIAGQTSKFFERSGGRFLLARGNGADEQNRYGQESRLPHVRRPPFCSRMPPVEGCE